ncbi:hypothetical protein C0991_000527 [Blastosporella zonata]|nr:hypothetical protein C0991_000527 [Blastosporella zonata]
MHVKITANLMNLPRRAFHAFGGFTSGLGIRYQESSIVSCRNQELATGLILGKRLPGQRLVRAADGRVFELQSLLPADTRFKLLVFTGDISDAIQQSKLTTFAADVGADDHFLKRYSPGGNISSAFDIISITSNSGSVQHTDLPELLRSHWSK